MKQEIMQEAIKGFKEEQKERIIEDVKGGLRSIVNSLCEISDIEKRIKKELKEKELELSDDFMEFLKTVKSYDNLIFSINSDGSVGIGTTAPDSPLFIFDKGKAKKVNQSEKEDGSVKLS